MIDDERQLETLLAAGALREFLFAAALCKGSRGDRLKAGRKATSEAFPGIAKRQLDAIQREAIVVMGNNKQLRAQARREKS